jgi:hypothetical protein
MALVQDARSYGCLDVPRHAAIEFLVISANHNITTALPPRNCLGLRQRAKGVNNTTSIVCAFGFANSDLRWARDC